MLAVIAVLSALLFPVLRQARNVAQQAVCASNFRQVGGAMSLYMADNDDYFPPATYRPGMQPSATLDRRWPQLIQPYGREFRIYRCPRDPFPGALPTASFDPDLVNLDPTGYDYALAERTNIGFNYLNLAPIARFGNQWRPLTRSQSEVATPANTLAAIDSVWDVTEQGRPRGGGSFLVVPPCRYATRGPTSIDTFRLPGFEVFLAKEPWKTSAPPVVYGGAWPWHDGKMTVIYADGHTKLITPMLLSQGCRVQDNLQGTVTSTGDYLWDLE